MNYNETTDEWSFDPTDGKEVTVMVTVPGIPLEWPASRVASWVSERLEHPIDSGYEAFVRTRAISEHPHGGENPEREGNGCMIHGGEKNNGE